MKQCEFLLASLQKLMPRTALKMPGLASLGEPLKGGIYFKSRFLDWCSRGLLDGRLWDRLHTPNNQKSSKQVQKQQSSAHRSSQILASKLVPHMFPSLRNDGDKAFAAGPTRGAPDPSTGRGIRATNEPGLGSKGAPYTPPSTTPIKTHSFNGTADAQPYIVSTVSRVVAEAPAHTRLVG